MRGGKTQLLGTLRFCPVWNQGAMPLLLAGITLSKDHVRRGTELAKEQGVHNARFQVSKALLLMP